VELNTGLYKQDYLKLKLNKLCCYKKKMQIKECGLDLSMIGFVKKKTFNLEKLEIIRIIQQINLRN